MGCRARGYIKHCRRRNGKFRRCRKRRVVRNSNGYAEMK